MTDKTAQRQFHVGKEIVRIFATGSDEDMYGEMLDVILDALDSTIGIFGYVDETGALVCPSLTREVWDQCQVPGKDIRFPREAWGGFWGRAMLEQRACYSNEPFQVPAGHVPVQRTMVVPLVHHGVLVGNLMVGNKASDYDGGDLRLLQAIGDMIAPVLHARVQRDQEERQREKAERALRQAHAELEQRVAERTLEMEMANEEPEPVRLVKPREADDWRGHGLVLVVDDEEMIRDTARMILEAVGFEVLLAADGREAVAVFRERADDIRVVLLDMTMPHMGGEEAFTELRRIRDGVRVVLSSGYNEQEATNRFAGKGLAGFIQKPYPPMKLAEILRGILGD